LGGVGGGGGGWDVEVGIDRTRAEWLGEENARELVRGQAVLGTGEGWTSKQKRFLS